MRGKSNSCVERDTSPRVGDHSPLWYRRPSTRDGTRRGHRRERTTFQEDHPRTETTTEPILHNLHNLSLVTLPEELIMLIFSFLPTPTLLDVCEVCSWFNVLSESAWKYHCYVRYSKFSKADFDRLFTEGTVIKLQLERLMQKKKLNSSDKVVRKRSNSLHLEPTTRISWKYVYYNKTKIENTGWLTKREPVVSWVFFTKEEMQDPFLHKYHLFPTVLIYRGDLVVAGSGAYEIAGDATTMLIGERLIRVWDVNNGLLQTLSGHQRATTSLDMNNKFYLSTSLDKTFNVALWDRETGDIDKWLLGHSLCVYQASFHDDIVISSSKDHLVKMWNIDSGACVHTITSHNKEVRAFVAKDSTLVTGCDDKFVRVFDMCLLDQTMMFDVDTKVNCMAIQGHSVLLGSDRKIKHYDLRTGQLVRQIVKKTGGNKFGAWIREIQADDNKLLAGDTKAKLHVIDWNTGTPLASLGLARNRLCFDYNSTTDVIVTGDSNKSVKCWNFSKDYEDPQGEEKHRCCIS